MSIQAKETAGSQRVCTGEFPLDAPPSQAFELFTPLGEIDWVPGWAPTFIHPSDGQLVEDQVFTTGDPGSAEHTQWWVIRLERSDLEVEYLRVTPDSRMARVSVGVRPGRSADQAVAQVTYRLTPLNERGATIVADFAAGFDEMLDKWHRLTADHLAQQ